MPNNTENIYFASILEDDDTPTYRKNERCGDVDREEVKGHLVTEEDPEELTGYLTF